MLHPLSIPLFSPRDLVARWGEKSAGISDPGCFRRRIGSYGGLCPRGKPSSIYASIVETLRPFYVGVPVRALYMFFFSFPFFCLYFARPSTEMPEGDSLQRKLLAMGYILESSWTMLDDRSGFKFLSALVEALNRCNLYSIGMVSRCDMSGEIHTVQDLISKYFLCTYSFLINPSSILFHFPSFYTTINTNLIVSLTSSLEGDQ